MGFVLALVLGLEATGIVEAQWDSKHGRIALVACV